MGDMVSNLLNILDKVKVLPVDPQLIRSPWRNKSPQLPGIEVHTSSGYFGTGAATCNLQSWGQMQKDMVLQHNDMVFSKMVKFPMCLYHFISLPTLLVGALCYLVKPGGQGTGWSEGSGQIQSCRRYFSLIWNINQNGRVWKTSPKKLKNLGR